jgi:hypothetical protein
MRFTTPSSLGLCAALAAASLVACSDMEPPPIEDADAGDRLQNPCVMSHAYVVQEDRLTYLCGHEFELDPRWNGEFQTGQCVSAEATLPPLFAPVLALHSKRGGRAELWSQGMPVVTVEIDRSWYSHLRTEIRPFESPTGQRAELHVLSRAECFTPPADPLTRAEVEELEN